MKCPIISTLCCIGLLLVCLDGCVNAQIDSGTNEPPKLISAPKASFPKNGGPAGKIIVTVEVDVNGNVTSAKDPSGPGPICQQVQRADVAALREAAKAAALKAKFKPAIVNGQPAASQARVEFEVVAPSVSAKASESVRVIGHHPPEYVGAINASSKQNKELETNTTEAPNKEKRYLAPAPTNLPKPDYPAAARAVRASGTVPVQVLIETDGSVFSAEAVGGHPLLQAAVVHAACSARFVPTLLSGSLVRVSGIITYNFVL